MISDRIPCHLGRDIRPSTIVTNSINHRYCASSGSVGCGGGDDIRIWQPVQSPLIQPLLEELKKGDEVSLYVARVGARKESGKVDWVFVVNEFEK
jgi:hypothetical protein